MHLRHLDRSLSLDKAVVVGILNVTPDSFSDGGLWLDPDAAIKHGIEMTNEGAGIVDVGGESTRPGAEPVPQEEELRRVLPVIEGLCGEGVVVSIDTRKTDVARRAIEAGASIINDTAGEESDRSMDSLAADSGAAIVVMHSRGTPATMRDLTEYGDVGEDVASFLETRVGELQDRGVPSDSIAIDPGIGFAKTAEQSVELLRRLEEVVALGPPVLVGTSRKSFIGQTLGLADGQRLEATIAANVWAVACGARIVRVHDVESNVRAIRMVEAVVAPEA